MGFDPDHALLRCCFRSVAVPVWRSVDFEAQSKNSAGLRHPMAMTEMINRLKGKSIGNQRKPWYKSMIFYVFQMKYIEIWGSGKWLSHYDIMNMLVSASDFRSSRPGPWKRLAGSRLCECGFSEALMVNMVQVSLHDICIYNYIYLYTII